MQNGGPSTEPPDDRRVKRLAAACLENLDELFDVWMQRMTMVMPSYGEGVVAVAELRADTDDVFEFLLRRIAGNSLPPRLEGLSGRLGAKRANQGVPLDALQEAARLDFTVIWEQLVARSQPDDLGALLGYTSLVWETIERHSRELTQSYLRTELEIARQSESERNRWFFRLVATGGSQLDVVESCARILNLGVAGRFVVAVADSSERAPLQLCIDRLTKADWRFHWQEFAAGIVLVVESNPRQDSKLLDILAATRCGIAPVTRGLSEVPAAIRLASVTLQVSPNSSAAPRHIRDAWLAVFVAQAPETARALTQEIFGPFAFMRPAEAESILQTVRAYCHSNGSVASVAKALFCHRNTVLNKLDRFREVAGVDVRSPEQAATVLLALYATDLFAPDSDMTTLDRW